MSRLADAVAEQFPERAVELWLGTAERSIARTKPAAYSEAMVPLGKARDLLVKHGKKQVWDDCLAGIRDRHRRKRRLMEILDSFERRPIVASDSRLYRGKHF